MVGLTQQAAERQLSENKLTPKVEPVDSAETKDKVIDASSLEFLFDLDPVV